MLASTVHASLSPPSLSLPVGAGVFYNILAESQTPTELTELSRLYIKRLAGSQTQAKLT